MHTFAVSRESDEIELAEAAMMAPRANLAAGICGPGWHWLASAAEMAATVTGDWTLAGGQVPPWCGDLPRLATRTAGPGSESVHAAREFTAATLRRWGVRQRHDDIVMVVSELLTNALRHGRPATWPAGQVQLGLLQPGSWVLCAVCDRSDRLPSPREPDWFEETGRGLHIVASLSDRWGCTVPTGHGKVVWATFATDPAWESGSLVGRSAVGW